MPQSVAIVESTWIKKIATPSNAFGIINVTLDHNVLISQNKHVTKLSCTLMITVEWLIQIANREEIVEKYCLLTLKRWILRYVLDCNVILMAFLRSALMLKFKNLFHVVN